MTNCEISHFYHNQAMKSVISLCNLHGALAIDTFQAGWLLSVLMQRTEQRRDTHRIKQTKSEQISGNSFLPPFFFNAVKSAKICWLPPREKGLMGQTKALWSNPETIQWYSGKSGNLKARCLDKLKWVGGCGVKPHSNMIGRYLEMEFQRHAAITVWEF